MDKQSNLRLILAVAISFVVIVVWSKFFAPDPTVQKSDSTQKTHVSQPSNVTNEMIPNSALHSTIANTNDNATDMKGVPTNLQSNKEILVRIQSEEFDIDIDVLGTISQAYLKADKYIQPYQENIFTHIGRLFGMVSGENKKLERLPLFATNVPLYPLQMIFIDPVYGQLANTTKYSTDKTDIIVKDKPETVTLTQNLGEIVVKKILTIYPNMTYDVQIILNKPMHYIISNGMRPNADTESYVFHGVLLQNTNGTIEKIEDGDAKAEGQNFNDVLFVASVDRYYTSLLYADKPLSSITVGAFGK